MADYTPEELLKAQNFFDQVDILISQMRFVRDHLEDQDPDTVKKALDSAANVLESQVNTGRMHLELEWVFNEHQPPADG